MTDLSIYNAILQSSPIAIIIIDEQSNILQWSGKAEKMFGWSEKEAVGNKLYNLIIPDKYKQAHIKGLERYKQTGISKLIDTQPVVLSSFHKNGSEFPINLTISKGFAHNKTFYIGFVEDLTNEQKLQLAFDQMERTYNNLKSVISKIPASVAVFNAKTWECILINDDFVQMLSKHDFQDKNPSATTFVDAFKVKEKTKNLKSTDELNLKKVQIGDTFFDVDIVPVTLDDTAFYLVFALDVTQVIKDEQEKNELYIREQTAIEKNKLKTDFLSNLSHEIRTPMHGVLGMTEFLLETSLSEQQKEYLKIIQQSMEILKSTVDAILDISQLEAGKLQLSYDCINLADFMSKLQHVYKFSTEKKNIDFNVEMKGENLDKLCFYSDVSRVSQILNNLIGNAIKFTEKGFVTLIVEKDDHTFPNDEGFFQLNFEVKDTGIGIKKDAMKMLFKPFTQLDDFSTKRYNGTGLGLYLSQNLARLLDSRIVAESTYGVGSTFTLQLYTRYCTMKAPPEPTVIPEALSILVAEDNIVNQRVIIRFLKYANYKVNSVYNGSEAVEEIRNNAHEYNMILMDIQMPEMNGYDATRYIRRLGFTLPIIAVTANAEPGEKEKCLAAGMDDYLAKPYKKEELLRKVEEWRR